MPSVCLSVADLNKLSKSALDEIYNLYPSFHSVQAASKNQFPKDDDDLGFDWLTELSPRQVSKCLAKPIDQKSVQLLKILAEHEGRARWSVVRDALGLKRWQDLKGVLSGLSRRIRSVTRNKKAVLVAWDSSEDEYDGDDYIDGYIKTHPETAKALNSYFGMSR